jgi:4-hydroxy-2-oxoheptanedioate aldolase
VFALAFREPHGEQLVRDFFAFLPGGINPTSGTRNLAAEGDRLLSRAWIAARKMPSGPKPCTLRTTARRTWDMRKNAIKATLAEGGRVVNGWLQIPSSYSAEMTAHQGFDSVTIDLQHGPVDFAAAVEMLQAISTTSAVPLARLAWNDPAMIMKVLDAGTYGLICPMINSKADAESFVAAARYAPRGFRSFGPNRAALYGGPDYVKHANSEILLLAMIETAKAVANLEEILAVPGLDGIYIGPSDLSLSMGKPPTLAPEDKDVLAAMERVRKTTREKGLIAGVHTDGAKTALKRFEEGFQFCTLLSESRYMASAMAAAVREVKGAPAGTSVSAKTY